MRKILLVSAITLAAVVSHAKSKQVMGIIAHCNCYESTIDGQKFLGKVVNKVPTRSESNARTQAFSQCQNEASEAIGASINNCQYIKAVDERIGKVIKRRIEKLKDDEENNLHNDLIGTL